MDANEAKLAVKAIQRQNQYAESLCEQLQDTRAWAKLWKRSAKDARRWRLFRPLWHDTCADLFMVRRENQELRAENVRLRAALRPFAEMNQTIEEHGSIPPDWVMHWADLRKADEVLNGGPDDD